MKQDVMKAIENARASLDQAMVSLEDVPETDAQMVRYTAHRLKRLPDRGGRDGRPARGVFRRTPGRAAQDLDRRAAARGSPDEPRRRPADADPPTARSRASGWKKSTSPCSCSGPATFTAARRPGKTSRSTPSSSPTVASLRPTGSRSPPSWTTCCRTRSNSPRTAGRGIWVDVRREQDHIVCTVRDEGPGFSAEDQTRLFRKGVRLANTPTGGRAVHRIRPGHRQRPGRKNRRRHRLRKPPRPRRRLFHPSAGFCRDALTAMRCCA